MDVLQTKVRLYQKLKVKSSLNLPADPKSMKQHIHRANHQLFEWLQTHIKLTRKGDLSNSGWVWDEEERRVVPIWFEGV